LSSVFTKATVLLITLLSLGRPAQAQSAPASPWQIDVVPLYFWATSLSGTLSAGPATLPVGLDFSDAKDNLGGAFSFHLEATRGRWAGFSDLYFIRLTSDAAFSVGPSTVQGDFELDNTIFEGGAAYLLSESTRLAVLGGIRTYTLSPMIRLDTAVGGVTPVDASETSPNGFAGIAWRPQLSAKWLVVTRADIGGGDANLTWSAEAGLGYRFRPWGGLIVGYKALGIDVDRQDVAVRDYDVVHHGPFFGLNLHFGKR
jgi:hypothetical protein